MMGEKNLKMQILQASKPKVVKFWDYSWHKPVDCCPCSQVQESCPMFSEPVFFLLDVLFILFLYRFFIFKRLMLLL